MRARNIVNAILTEQCLRTRRLATQLFSINFIGECMCKNRAFICLMISYLSKFIILFCVIKYIWPVSVGISDCDCLFRWMCSFLSCFNCCTLNIEYIWVLVRCSSHSMGKFTLSENFLMNSWIQDFSFMRI